jgi:hypothetical protein
MKESEVEKILDIHISINNLQDIISKDLIQTFLDTYKPKLKDFTASHIAVFIEKIRLHYEFEKNLDENYEITIECIDKIFLKILINEKDIINNNEIIRKWVDARSNNRDKLDHELNRAIL